jgi:hypothetical protein
MRLVMKVASRFHVCYTHCVYTVHFIYQAGWSKRNAPEFYSREAPFESPPALLIVLSAVIRGFSQNAEHHVMNIYMRNNFIYLIHDLLNDVFSSSYTPYLLKW